MTAIGAQFQRAEFPGSDCDDVVYGNAAQIRARTDVGDPVVIVGGWDGPGEAALLLADHQRPVTLLSRSYLREEMNSGLIAQLEVIPTSLERGAYCPAPLTVMEGAEIASADIGPNGRMHSVTLMDGRILPAKALGLFIGLAPETEWTGLDTNDEGYIMTGGPGRAGLETSMPGVFAAGDVQSDTPRPWTEFGRITRAHVEGTLAMRQALGSLSPEAR